MQNKKRGYEEQFMLNRRDFVAAGVAAAALGPGVATAHSRANFVLPPEFMPVQVEIGEGFAPGEIHVNPNTFKLYWTLPDQTAIRYSVGVGRRHLYEPGVFYVGAKKEWPSWTPTPDMIKREPDHYAKWADGMPGGANNPLGARALYLYVPGKGDSFLRIHGTGEPWTIGTEVSNGCARLVNDHVIDLYDRVPVGTRVVLYSQTAIQS